MLSYKDLTSISLPLLHLALEAGREILEVYRSDNLQVRHKADLSPLTLADTRAHEVIDAGLIQLAPEIPVVSEEGRDVPFPERRAWTEFWLVDPLDGTKEFIKGNGEFTVNIGLVQNGVPTFGVIYAPVCGVAYLGLCPAADAGTPGAATAADAAGRSAGPAPGAWRFVVDHDLTGAYIPGEEELAQRAEPITGRRPVMPPPSGAAPPGAASTAARGATTAGGPTRITMIGSRSHIGRRTRAFMNRLSEGFDEVKLLHIGSSLKLCMLAEGSANIYPRFWPTMEWDTAAGHALIRAAGGEVWQAPRDGHKPLPDWLKDEPVDAATQGGAGNAGAVAATSARRLEPLQYNKKSMRNGPFVARGW